MGNEIDVRQKQGRTSPYWNMVQAMASEGLSNIEISRQIQKAGGSLSRERIRVMRKALGIKSYKRYPQTLVCRSKRGQPHSFLAMSPQQRYCRHHRLHTSTCDVCWQDYRTRGGTDLCRSCASKVKVVAHNKARQAKLVQLAKQWLAEGGRYGGE